MPPFIYQWVDVWVVPMFGFCRKYCYEHLCASLCGHRLAFLLDMFLKVELLGQYSDSVLASGKLSDWFSPRLRHCTFPSAGQEHSSSSTSLPTLVDNICLFIIAILSSKGLYAQRSNTKTFSGISFITFACHALPCLVSACKSHSSHQVIPYVPMGQ